MHDYLKTVPFDLYSLFLFQLVVRHRSFTQAARLVGITQSAITRQIQTMENALGIDLLNRTTRSVEVTDAGKFLFQESSRLTGDVESLLQRLRENHGEARPQIRIGVSRTVSQAHLPGLLHANLRRSRHPTLKLRQIDSSSVVSELEANDLDVGIITRPSRLPKTLRVAHEFKDGFILVLPATIDASNINLNQRRQRLKWAEQQTWILPDESSTCGRQLRRWMKINGWPTDPSMEVDNFDLLINLISLGMGIGFVPIRAIAAFGRKHTLKRVALKNRFERSLIVVVRHHRKMPVHFQEFVDNILF